MKMAKSALFCAVAGTAALAAIGVAPAHADPNPTIPGAYVTGVIDGDTISVVDIARGPLTVHIAGVDAPELTQCWGPQSRDFTVAALERQLVALIVDPSLPAFVDGGEVPAYVVRVDGWNHSIESARAGAARRGAPISRTPEIGAAEDGARATGTGLWGAVCGTPPPVAPAPRPAPPAVYYKNCDDARAKNAAPVLRGQPGYRSGLDSDGDGIGCEPRRR